MKIKKYFLCCVNLLKNIIKKFWILILIPVIIAVGKDLILNNLKNVDIISTIKSIFKDAYNFIKNVLNYQVSLWIIIIVFIIFMIIYKIIDRFLNYQNNNETKKWYEEYTNDIYNKIYYKWSYYNSYGDLEIKYFRPVCNKCKGELVEKQNYRNHYYSIPKNYCPNCDKIFDSPTEEEEQEARVYIHNKLVKMQQEIKEKV